MGVEANIIYYRTMHEQAAPLSSEDDSFQSLLYTLNLRQLLNQTLEDDSAAIAKLMCDASLRLLDGGANFIAVTSNTGSTFAKEIQQQIGVQIFDIVQPVCHRVADAGVRKAGLLGTSRTKASGLYQGMSQTLGFELISCSDALQKQLDRIIFDELLWGLVSPQSIAVISESVLELSSAGAEAVILGCTDFSLIKHRLPEKSVPIFDSATIHAQAIARAAFDIT